MSVRLTIGFGLAVVGLGMLAAQPSTNRDQPSSLMIAGGKRDTVKKGAEDPRAAVGWIESVDKVGTATRAGVCTGTLIAPDIVLTALHCFLDSMPEAVEPAKSTFRVGWKKNKPVDSVEVARVEYLRKPKQRSSWETASSFTSYYASDMALAYLSRPVKGEVAPLPIDCVRESDLKATMQSAGFGLGWWGPRSYRFRAAVKADSTLVMPFKMKGSTGDYPNSFANGLVVAPAADSKESGLTCSGDSGGPLIVQRSGKITVIGSLSTGDDGCTKKGKATYSMITEEVAARILKSVKDGWPSRLTLTDSCKFGSYLGL
jgi:hypothetical protein